MTLDEMASDLLYEHGGKMVVMSERDFNDLRAAIDADDLTTAKSLWHRITFTRMTLKVPV